MCSKMQNDEWSDWRWQLKNAVRSPNDLPPWILSDGNAAWLAEAHSRFPLAITPYYLSLIEKGNQHDPLLRMSVPSPEELQSSPNLAEDPIAEQEHSPVPGLIRRYPDRAVLLVSGRCAVNCRHCTRRNLGRGRIAPLGRDGLKSAFEYLRENPEIRDVILSGGDPLLEEDSYLEEIVKAVRDIQSVEIIRVGTRAPVTLPMRINEDLAALLARFSPLWVCTQFNHPREVTAEASRACARLVERGVPVLNQAVLLKGVNDDPETIEELSRAMLRIRVKPYYLFLCDLWPGLEHMRTSIQTGIEIMEHLRGRLSGLGIPALIADLPGGIGKVQLGPDYVVSKENGGTVLRSPDGRLAFYPDPVEDQRIHEHAEKVS
jgi:lysine 2,3-aminomutase